jgi:hypothetical protein
MILWGPVEYNEHKRHAAVSDVLSIEELRIVDE